MSQEKKGRLIAFRIVAVIGGVLHAAPIVFLGASLTGGDMKIHAVHNTAGLVMFTGVVALGWVLAAVAPERMLAPFQAATLAAACIAVAAALAADPQGALFTSVPAVILLILHPARPLLWRLGRTAPAPLGLAAIAVVPAVWFALKNASLQRNGATTDPHVEMHHWTGMAAFALTAVTVALVAGLGGRNHRILAISGGLGVVLFGAISLGYDGYPGAVGTGWAIACIVWGAALAGDGWRMARDPATPSSATSTGGAA